MAAISGRSFVSKDLEFPTNTQLIFGCKVKSRKIEKTQLRFSKSLGRIPSLQLKASRESSRLTQELKTNTEETLVETQEQKDVFDEMKHRFLKFKKHTYMGNLEHFKDLAEAQAPKFLVIACADSRVCPSTILGLQPGDAFMVRNIANLVPPYETGPSETKAALEFSVNFLNVENILVIGHSCCGGIRALMSMDDEDNDSRSFIRNWVIVGKKARTSTKAVVSGLDFDQQCQHCEKESLNNSLLNLLSYPWIKEKVRNGELSIHGGYYDFVTCSFEKWTLDSERTRDSGEGRRIVVKDRSFWS